MKPTRVLVVLAYLSLAGFVIWRLAGRYTGPWEGFQPTAQAFLAAAVAHDSSALTRLAGNPSAAESALALSAHHPERLTKVSRLQVWTGARQGDTTRIVYAHDPCPLMFTFVGTGGGARIHEFAAACPEQ